MLYSLLYVLYPLIPVATAKTAGQLCRGTATRADDGNWYCSEVTAITYKNIGQAGEYNRTTKVNPKTGLCDHEPVSYSGVGPTTPLIGELSMHLRGPMNVSQIAVYRLPDMSTSKRRSVQNNNVRREEQRRQEEVREVQGTIRSVWNSFWHHTHDDPETNDGSWDTTKGASGSTSESKAFTTEQISATASRTFSTSILQLASTTTQNPATSPAVQTKDPITTTIVHTVPSQAGQASGSTLSQMTLNEPNSLCTVTPKITTTVIVQGSTCPNPLATITKTQTEILAPPPIVPVPLPVPFPVPGPPPPVQPVPVAVPAPAPPPPAPPAALSPLVYTSFATTTTTTTKEITDTECPKSPLNTPLASHESDSIPGTDKQECPCVTTSVKPANSPPPTPIAVPPPPPPPAPVNPPPPAADPHPPLPPPSSVSPSTSPCLDPSNSATVTVPSPFSKRGASAPVVADSSSTTPAAGHLSPRDEVNIAAASTWSRVAYYTSTAPAAASGFAFLANLGDPQKSGTFDYAFGNSLGYVIGDGSKVAAQNTPFSGILETSEREIAAFTDKACDGDCEYARPDTIAHYGWEGPSKAFFIEFQMDHYDNYGDDQGMLSDAPAWWFLNAAIPRILQYGNDRNNIPCSCWSTGCGEFDAFEILGRGEMRAKSTIHRQGNLEGGDSNYFLRPVGRTIKFAVVFHNWNITARVLDDGFDFGASLTQAQIDDILAYDMNDYSHSLFSIGD